jgi:hypothetical protein
MFENKKKIKELENHIKVLSDVVESQSKCLHSLFEQHERLMAHLGLEEITMPGTPEQVKIVTEKEAEKIRKSKWKQNNVLEITSSYHMVPTEIKI